MVKIQVLPAKASGTARLSSNLNLVVDASAIVARIEPTIQMKKNIDEYSKIQVHIAETIKETTKKAMLPCKDLSRKGVFPNFRPISAAAISERMTIEYPMIARGFGKIATVMQAAIITHDAPFNTSEVRCISCGLSIPPTIGYIIFLKVSLKYIPRSISKVRIATGNKMSNALFVSIK